MPNQKTILVAILASVLNFSCLGSGPLLAAGSDHNNRTSAMVASDIGFGLSVRTLQDAGSDKSHAGEKQDAEPPTVFQPAQIVVSGQPEEFQDFRVLKSLPQSGQVLLAVPPGLEKAYIKAFREEGLDAVYNLIATKAVATSDTFSGYQWNFERVQAEAAWSQATGLGVVVAVLDTGLDSNGPDGVSTCLEHARDFTGNSAGWLDGDGHGTHVSGTVAQTTDNARGVAGLAYGACVMPVKVLDDTGRGTFVDIAEGVYHAVDHGAKVINLSLGTVASAGMVTDSVLAPALDYAEQHGVVVVASAGNDGYGENVAYPASYVTTLAVGATDYVNQRTNYSNYGKYLDVMAPGGDIHVDRNGDGYSDGILQETVRDGRWSYYFYQGTSMSAPHVSAIAALLFERNAELSAEEVRHLITNSAMDLGAEGKDSGYGYGLVQASDALNSLLTEPEPVNVSPVAAFDFSCSTLTCLFSGSRAYDEDGRITQYQWHFGDGRSASGSDIKSPSHDYIVGGIYQVKLTVTDDQGQSSSITRSVSVTAPKDNISLSASGSRFWLTKTTRLSWSGSSAAKVDIYRSGKKLATTANDGAYSSTTYGTTQYSYQVCNAGTQVCSQKVVY